MQSPKTMQLADGLGRLKVVFLMLLASTVASAQSKDEALKISPSSMQKLTEGIAFAGSPSRGTTGHLNRQEATIGAFTYYPGTLGCGLVKEEIQSGLKICLNLRDLATKAGWSNNTRFFSDNNPYGLFGVRESLWMGTNAIGILVYNTRSETWTRYDVKSIAIAGDISRVVRADDEYVFVAVGGPRQEIPDRKPSLDVYSFRHQRWLRIDAIPTRDALALGHSGPFSQISFDDRDFLAKSYIPLCGTNPGISKSPPSEISRSEAGYILRYTYSEGNKTELLLRRVLLESAFDGR